MTSEMTGHLIGHEAARTKRQRKRKEERVSELVWVTSELEKRKEFYTHIDRAYTFNTVE